jgi:hypothetical protein
MTIGRSMTINRTIVGQSSHRIDPHADERRHP